MQIVEETALTSEQITQIQKEQERQNYGNTRTGSEETSNNGNSNSRGGNSLGIRRELRQGESEESRRSIPREARARDSSTTEENGCRTQSRREEGRSRSQESLTSTQIAEHYSKLDFANPAQMYAYFRPALQTGEKKFHKWQVEELLRVSQPNYTVEQPLKLLLAACNGSGKDSYVIAPAAVWLALCNIRHRIIITSSSYNQINTQTEPYISALCNDINRHFLSLYGLEIFSIVKGLIKCLLSGSEIRLVVTDEPGRVEGYHPFDDHPLAEMTVILNEAKSIDDEIIKATSRWTGFTRWLEVSSTGRRTGLFHEKYKLAIKYPQERNPEEWYARRITVYDCPHISKSQIRDDERLYGGITSELFRSKNLSEFTDVDGDLVVISESQIRYCMTEAKPVWDSDISIRAGLDLSLGGDAVVLTSRKGNTVAKQDVFRQKDATVLRDALISIFPSHHISKDIPIYTDASGLGEPICNMLRELGWNVIMIKNNTRAFKPNLYANRGTELWFNFGNWVAQGKVRFGPLINKNEIIQQLSNRHYDRPDNDKFKLWSKADEKSLGIHSPDEADSLVLCFCNFEPTENKEARRTRQKNAEVNHKRITQTDLVEVMAKDRYRGMEGELTAVFSKPQKSFGGMNQTALIEYNLKQLQQKGK